MVMSMVIMSVVVVVMMVVAVLLCLLSHSVTCLGLYNNAHEHNHMPAHGCNYVHYSYEVVLYVQL